MYHPIKRTKCCVKPDELVTLIKKHYLDKTKTVKYQTTDGSEVSHITYSFEAKLKDCEVPINFVVILGKWNKDDVTDVHILITNQLNASAKTVITNYLLRWGIEHCFKELKDTFYFDHYQVRHIEKIERYWNLCLIAWTLTYWIKQNALRKNSPPDFYKVMILLKNHCNSAPCVRLQLLGIIPILCFPVNPSKEG